VNYPKEEVQNSLSIRDLLERIHENQEVFEMYLGERIHDELIQREILERLGR
jgi:hypothetical protein